MKLNVLFSIALLSLNVTNAFAQINVTNLLSIPFLDTASQSHGVVVAVCDFNAKQCPQDCTNVLSNTNLFTGDQKSVISGVFEKYKNIATNSGLSGAILKECYRTNRTVRVLGRTMDIESWIAKFQYTNFPATEELMLGEGGLLAKYRSKSNGCYNVSFTRTGRGTMLRFTEMKDEMINGLLASFDDGFPQGTHWDFRRANPNGYRLTEYRQYTNGLVLGRFLMWNSSGNLTLEADFKEPYEFERHRTDLGAFQSIRN